MKLRLAYLNVRLFSAGCVGTVRNASPAPRLLVILYTLKLHNFRTDESQDGLGRARRFY